MMGTSFLYEISHLASGVSNEGVHAEKPLAQQAFKAFVAGLLLGAPAINNAVTQNPDAIGVRRVDRSQPWPRRHRERKWRL